MVGGTINGSGVLYVLVTAVGADTTLAQIMRVVAEAQHRKPAIQAFANPNPSTNPNPNTNPNPSPNPNPNRNPNPSQARAQHGLELVAREAMPANNFLLIFRKAA